jgi:threonine/homoserine/homoserine lactone efflux protein
VPPSLALILFWASVIACAVAHVAIVRSLLRASPRRLREVAWAIGPAFVLAAVLVITWRAMHITG